MPLPLAQVDFNSFLQKNYIDIGGIVIVSVVGLGLLLCFIRWRGTFMELLRVRGPALSRSTITRATLSNVVVNVLYQKPVADCSRTRWAMHFTMFWGFIGLAIATTLDAILNPAAAPLPFLSPVRVVGNVGGVLFMFGVTLSLGRRVVSSSVRRDSSLGDFLFLGVLFLAGLTGFLTEFLSDLNVVYPDYFVFWSHLLLVSLLLVTAPFSKFVHAVGRPALLLVKRLAKEKSDAAASE
ncbi:MAG: respiratory nitrate reductase subunit gamma [Thaumarchaeota archaeon]|nr:respiratory nitrate reductase subunit gamma [Nitrososphaerota archaeon]